MGQLALDLPLYASNHILCDTTFPGHAPEGQQSAARGTHTLSPLPCRCWAWSSFLMLHMTEGHLMDRPGSFGCSITSIRTMSLFSAVHTNCGETSKLTVGRLGHSITAVLALSNRYSCKILCRHMRYRSSHCHWLSLKVWCRPCCTSLVAWSSPIQSGLSATALATP